MQSVLSEVVGKSVVDCGDFTIGDLNFRKIRLHCDMVSTKIVDDSLKNAIDCICSYHSEVCKDLAVFFNNGVFYCMNNNIDKKMLDCRIDVIRAFKTKMKFICFASHNLNYLWFYDREQKEAHGIKLEDKMI